MLHHLRGRLAFKKPLDHEVVLEAGGVGYLLRVPASTLDRLPDIGAEITLFTHLHFAESNPAAAFNLFGFRTEIERTVFRMLLKVDRVGPAQALAVMSGVDTPALVAAVRDKNVHLLRTIKGVGEKLAERIVNELAEAFRKVAAELPASAGAGMSRASADALAVLMSLGLSQADAAQRVDAASKSAGAGATADEIVRRCLAT
jgi:holliday junction DNA helicase RuvA